MQDSLARVGPWLFLGATLLAAFLFSPNSPGPTWLYAHVCVGPRDRRSGSEAKRGWWNSRQTVEC